MHFLRSDLIRTWWVSKLWRYVFRVIFHFCIRYYNAVSQSSGGAEKQLQPIQHQIQLQPRAVHTTRHILLQIYTISTTCWLLWYNVWLASNSFRQMTTREGPKQGGPSFRFSTTTHANACVVWSGDRSLRSQEKIKIYEIRHPPGSRMLGIQDRLCVCLLGFKGASTTSVILPP